MTVRLDWLIKGEVIYHLWWGTGTMDEVRYVNQRTLDLYAEFPAQPRIHTISNALHQKNTEASIASARRAYTALDHYQTGWVLLAFDNPFLAFIGNIVLQLSTKNQFRIQRDLDHCFNYLKDVDTTVNWNHADWSLIQRFEAEMNSNS